MAARTGNARPNVPVRDDLRRDLRERPDIYGFAPGTSEARMLADLVELGARVRREETRSAARSETYRAWAADPEARDATREAMEIAIDGGLV